MVGQYAGMVNIVTACQIEMETLTKNLADSNTDSIIETIDDRLNMLITFHSLKMTDGFSLTQDETAYLLKENKTVEAKSFFEQLKVFNHNRILQHCRQYQQALKDAGWNLSLPYKDPPDEYVLAGLSKLADTFVLMFSEGLSGHFDMMYGNVHPAGTFYFFDRFEEQNHIKKGSELLAKTLKQGTYDPFLNAAIIHNEFAKGHQVDNKFGLLFCRLHMNFALMLTGYSPAIIDSSQKDEYLKIVQKDKLDDPKPLAKFLVKNLKETYQKYILPELEAEANKKNIPIPFELGHSINVKH